MSIFWILAAGLAGLALLFVLAPLLGPTREPAAGAGQSGAGADDGRGQDDVDLDRLNLDLFEQQVAELDADLAAGKLEQSRYDSARQDLEREALSNVGAGMRARPRGEPSPGARSTALALLLVVPAAALALYLLLGNQDIIPRLEASLESGAADRTAAALGHGGTADGTPALDELVARLEARMQQTPEDAEGWIMLGRTYFALRDPLKAEAALAKAYALVPTDTELVLAYAEAIAANNGNSLLGRPSELIAAALQLAPEDVTARWLSGMASFQRGQFNAAVVAWRSVLAEIDPDSDDAAQLRASIANAEQRAGIPPEARLGGLTASVESATAAAGAPTEGAAKAAPVGDRQSSAPDAVPTDAAGANEAVARSDAAAAGIEVAVSLSPALAARAAPDSTVFVYAKAAAGPPMPLAVQRLKVADLPATLRLDDDMAMTPAMKLSGFPSVIVGARVSATGQATPRAGDLEGEIGPIPSRGAGPVAVTIERVRP